ncbi:hypothetical protein CANINC_002924 [Pichia inconspicua]|uniref:Pal1 cell morphology protein n=1 Tax=Pichia inconspicua TaxID=52247 RepID=A0A4T0X1P2_9ASCO|nr:hypothetical protein CANINC_002924 [[Candida] inconspicua]
MYNHPNPSVTSSGSGRRISSNNPFRSALLQEERSRVASPTSEDPQYKTWLNQKIEEEKEVGRRKSDDLYDDNYYDDYYNEDANSFEEGDEFDHLTKPPTELRPDYGRAASENSLNRKDSYNPFATNRRNSGNSNSTPTRSNIHVQSRQAPPPPPSYEEVVGKRYAKDEYPKDEKNPFPSEEHPRRSNTVNIAGRRPAPPPPPAGSSKPQRLDPEQMTSTTTTRILSDGRVRSKSTGDPDSVRHRSGSNHHRHYPSSDANRSHRHQSREHKDRPRERERYRDDERPRRSGTRKKKFVQEIPKNIDTIDKLDVTGFFGGSKFHHDGPFDACTPQRNKDTKAAPVAAFPIDGPNNSITGMAPENSKDAQYDMVFGIDQAADSNAAIKPRSGSTGDQLNRGYTNGTIIRRADSGDLQSIVATKPVLAQVDAGATEKLYGDTTLGLGSSTFMDGAPAYGAKSTVPKEDGLSRKKTFLGRMKTIVRK